MEDFLLGIFLVTSSSRGYSLPFRYPENIFDSQRDSKKIHKHRGTEKKPFLRKKKSKNKLISKNIDSNQDFLSYQLNNAESNTDQPLDTRSVNIATGDPFSQTLAEAHQNSVDVTNTSNDPSSKSNVDVLNSSSQAAQTASVEQVRSLRSSRKHRQIKSVFHHKAKKPANETPIGTFPEAEKTPLNRTENGSLQNLARSQTSDTNISSYFEKESEGNENSKPPNTSNKLEHSHLANSTSAVDIGKSVSGYQLNQSIKALPSTLQHNPKPFTHLAHKKKASIDSFSTIDRNELDKNKAFLFESDQPSAPIKPPTSGNLENESSASYNKTHYEKRHTRDHYSSSSDNYHSQSDMGYHYSDFTTSTIYGFDVKLLAQILTTRKNQYSQFFQIGIDDMTFLSYTPLDSSTNVRDTTALSSELDKLTLKGGNAKNTNHKNHHTKTSNSNESFDKSASSAQTSILDSSKFENSKSQPSNLFFDHMPSSELESGKNSRAENLFSTSGAENQSNEDQSLGNHNSGLHVKKKHRFSFYVVLMMRENSFLSDNVQEKLYHCLLKPLNEAMKCEQENTNWIYKESLIMRRILKAAQRERWGIEKYWRELFTDSELASVLKTVYDNTLSMGCTHLMLNSSIPLSINVPPTPLILRQATNAPASQAWYYFGASNSYKLSRPNITNEYAEKIHSTDLKHTSLISEFEIKNPSSFQKKLDSTTSIAAVFSQKATTPTQNLYGLGFELLGDESDKSFGHNQSEHSSEFGSSAENVHNFKPSKPRSNFLNSCASPAKRFISLTNDIKSMNIETVTRTLSHLESEFPSSKNSSAQQEHLPSSNYELDSQRSKIDFLDSSYGVIGYDNLNDKHGSASYGAKQSNIDSLLYNYNRLLTSSVLSNTTVFPVISNTSNLVSAGELLPLDNSLYPTIEPYHALLLLNDPEKILTRVGSDASPSLVRLILKATPTQQLAELHPLIDCSFAQICRLCAHLVYWGEARIICPASTNNVYMNRPKINIAAVIKTHEEQFASLFSGYSLRTVLASLHLHQPFRDSLNSIPNLSNTPDTSDVDYTDYVNGEQSTGINPNIDTKAPLHKNSEHSARSGIDTKGGAEKDSTVTKNPSIGLEHQKNEKTSRKNTVRASLEISQDDIKHDNSQGSSLGTHMVEGFSKFKVKNLLNLSLLVGSMDFEQEGKSKNDEKARESYDPGLMNEAEPEKEKDDVYQDILVYLLRNKIVVQKYVWPILLVPLYVKLGLSQSKHTKLLRQQYKTSLENESYAFTNEIEPNSEFIGRNLNIKDNVDISKSNFNTSNEKSMNGFMKNYYFSWRPTSGFSFASATERSYLLKITADKPQNLVPWFLDMTIYFNGKHHLDEILYREFLTMSQFERFIEPFEDLITKTSHY